MVLSPVQPPAPGVTLLALPEAQRLPALLRSGRPVQAYVVADTTGRLLVAIGRTRLSLDGQLALRAGESLTVRLVNSSGTQMLEILTRESPPPAAALGLLRQALPRQEAPGTLLAALRDLRAQPQSWNGLPGELQRSIDEVLTHLAPSTRLQQPEGLRTALRDSGVLLEWLLARYPQAAGQIAEGDFKAALLRLITRLSDTAATAARDATTNGMVEQQGVLDALLQHAQGALARLHLLQLQPMASSTRLDLAFQIPLVHGNNTDDLYLRIRHQTEDETAAQRTGKMADRGWEVKLRFRFAGCEALAARLHIVGHRATVTWWTQDTRLAAALEMAQPVLAERLQALDLEVARIHCHRTQAPPERDDATRYQGGLIHETA